MLCEGRWCCVSTAAGCPEQSAAAPRTHARLLEQHLWRCRRAAGLKGGVRCPALCFWVRSIPWSVLQKSGGSQGPSHEHVTAPGYTLLHSPLKVPPGWVWVTLSVRMLQRWHMQRCSVPAFPAWFGTHSIEQGFPQLSRAARVTRKDIPCVDKGTVKIPTWTWGLWGTGFPDQYYFRNGSSNGSLAFR